VFRAKPNVPNVRLAKIEFKKMCGGKNKKYRRVAGKKALFICVNEICVIYFVIFLELPPTRLPATPFVYPTNNSSLSEIPIPSPQI